MLDLFCMLKCNPPESYHQWVFSLKLDFHAGPCMTIMLLLNFIKMMYNITSGKNFIKITSVGMGAAKSNETR